MRSSSLQPPGLDIPTGEAPNPSLCPSYQAWFQIMRILPINVQILQSLQSFETLVGPRTWTSWTSGPAPVEQEFGPRTPNQNQWNRSSGPEPRTSGTGVRAPNPEPVEQEFGPRTPNQWNRSSGPEPRTSGTGVRAPNPEPAEQELGPRTPNSWNRSSGPEHELTL